MGVPVGAFWCLTENPGFRSRITSNTQSLRRRCTPGWPENTHSGCEPPHFVILRSIGVPRSFGPNPRKTGASEWASIQHGPVGDRPGRDRPGQDRPGRDRPGRDRPGRDRPGRDRPGRDRPGRDRPGRDRPGRDNGNGWMVVPIEAVGCLTENPGFRSRITSNTQSLRRRCTPGWPENTHSGCEPPHFVILRSIGVPRSFGPNPRKTGPPEWTSIQHGPVRDRPGQERPGQEDPVGTDPVGLTPTFSRHFSNSAVRLEANAVPWDRAVTLVENGFWDNS